MYLKLPFFRIRELTFMLFVSIGSLILTSQKARSQTIVDIASGNDDFSILVEAVVKAGLAEKLSTDGPLTVFAPTNKAFKELFKAIGVDGVNDLSKEQLTPMLLYHVVSGNLLSTSLSDGQKAGTLFENDVTVGKKQDVIKINGSKVIQADIMASNGIIHAINQVLIPPGKVVSFTLINAETNEDIMEVNNRDVINFKLIGTKRLNIRANIDPEITGSVKFTLDGNELRTENKFPYAAFSDAGGDYFEWSPIPSLYTLYKLNATPYSGTNGTGVEGPTQSISFSFNDEPNIMETLISRSRASIFVQAIEKAGLVDLLSGKGPLYIFVPDNDAFDQLFETLGVNSIDDLSAEKLRPILLYHITRDDITFEKFYNGRKVSTLIGNDLIATIEEFQDQNLNPVQIHMINGSVIWAPFNPANNGEINYIKDVLIPPGLVESYTLVNAETNEDIMEINDGDTLNIAMIGTNQLNIRANINLGTTGSVKFILNGAELGIENISPYAAFSDKNGDYNVWEPELIDYDLITTPFSQAGAGGVAGPTDTLSFTVVGIPNIVQLARQTPDLSILVEAVVKADLVEALSGPGPLTVFAPTNQAFAVLFQDLGVNGLEDLTAERLRPILLYHLVGEGLLSTDLNDGETLTTLETSDVLVSVEGEGRISINNSEFLLPDIVASNGVIHAVNRVLLPPSDGTGNGSVASREFEINAYPNPATNILTINPLQDQFSNTTNVVIYHSKGKIYYQGQMSSENNGQLNINVANYPAGIYLIKLQSGSQEETIRVYKK